MSDVDHSFGSQMCVIVVIEEELAREQSASFRRLYNVIILQVSISQLGARIIIPV